MRVQATQQDSSNCITTQELARLFDDAFVTWQSQSDSGEGARRTPRIAVRGAKPLFLVSYAHDGHEVDLNTPAALVDISADGLGVAVDRQLPVGAAVRCAFDDHRGAQDSGEAFVARVTRTGNSYHVGLTFGEDARSIDASSPAFEIRRHYQAPRGWPRRLQRVREIALFAYRFVAQRDPVRKELSKTANGQTARLVVDTKPFWYRAVLYVDDRKVARQSGALNDRLRSLLSGPARPTIIKLEGGGFLGWAAVRANAVTACGLDLSLQRKQQLCSQALQGVSELADLFKSANGGGGLDLQHSPTVASDDRL